MAFSKKQEIQRKKINALKKSKEIDEATWRKARRALYKGVETSQKVLDEALKAAKKDEKKATNENVEASNLEQHILTQNIDKAANYFTSNRNMFNYRTFRQINGDGAQLVNRLRGIDNLDVFYKIKTSVLSLMVPKIKIFKVTHEEFVLTEDGRVDQGKITPLGQPCYKEFKFSDNFGVETAATVQDYLAHESTKPTWRNVGLDSFSVTQSGKAHGIIENNIVCKLQITFKSLKDLQASPPGEPSPEKGGLRYADLITWAPARIDRETDLHNPKHYELKAFLGYTAPTKEQLRALNLSEKDIQAIANIEKLNVILSLTLLDYTIKIKDNGQVLMTADYRGRLETVIGTNQVNIFQNTFRLTKEGAIDISKRVNAKYNISSVYKLRATLISLYRQLKRPACKDDRCEAYKNLKSLVETDQFLTAALKDGFAVNNKMPPATGLLINTNGEMKIKGDGTELFTFFKEAENVEKILAFIKKKVGLFKKDIYKTFVDQLIDGNTAPDTHGTRLFCIEAGSKAVEKSLGVILDDKYIKDTPGMDEELSNEEMQTLGSAADEMPQDQPEVRIDRCHLVSPIDPAIRAAALADIDAAVDDASKSKDEKAAEKSEPHKDPARTSVRDFSGKKHKFYFVYLGDIIELACKNAGLGQLNLKSSPGIFNEGYPVFSEESYFRDDKQGILDYPLKNARILLGPVEFYDNKGNLKTINLAQFPISFNYFRAWFMRKIVRRQRSQMPLGAFITSLINSLVMPALGVGMPRSYKAPKTRSNMVALTLPGKRDKNTGVERRECGGNLGLFSEALPMKQVIDMEGAEFKQEYLSVIKDPAPTESLIKTSYDYLLLYVTTRKSMVERRANPIQDVRDGIYHFNIGSDMGLLKNMSFSRVKIKGLVELRSTQAEEQGVDSLDQLKFPYNTNLTLVGTSLFTPGMYYYVNPSLAGLGAPEDAASLAYKMNLGGYHLVMAVTTKVSSGKFETSIEGIQTAQGRR